MSININTTPLPLLVAFTLDGERTRYGVLTGIKQKVPANSNAVERTAEGWKTLDAPADCTVVEVNTNETHKVSAEFVDTFQYGSDYMHMRDSTGPQEWMKEIVIRTTGGRVATLEDIRLVSPYPEHTAFVKFDGETRRSEIRLSNIERFIGHRSVNMVYE